MSGFYNRQPLGKKVFSFKCDHEREMVEVTKSLNQGENCEKVLKSVVRADHAALLQEDKFRNS